MKERKKLTGVMAGAVVVLTAIGFAAVSGERKDVSRRSSETSVFTNDNGSVSRAFTECTVSTNGNLVTEHRRETRTMLDADGNMLESSTSEYAQSYTIGDTTPTLPRPSINENVEKDNAVPNADSFLGLKFGETFEGTNFVNDADEPVLLRATFRPVKPLSGFDDFYVYVTPKTHKIAKVYACAKNAVEPDSNWRRHYLIEALEKRYQTWARLRSPFRPIYSFNIGSGRYIKTILAGATCDYETIIVAWDEALLATACDEAAEIRAEARRASAAKRSLRVKNAADAF